MKPKSALRSCLALAGSSVLGISCVHAASGSWNINSGGNWTDITKWTGGLDYASGADSTATFNNVITVDRVINLNTGITIGHISALDATHNYTISGGNILTLDTTTGIPSISVGGAAARTLTISSEIAGNDGLDKIGVGILLLSGANTYTGGTTLTTGTLSIGHANALDGTGTLALAASVTFQSSDSTARTMSNLVTIAGGNGTPTNFGGTGNLTFTNTGVSDLGSTTRHITVASGITVSFAHDFTGSAGFTKLNPGTLVLTGPSSYTGITSIGGSAAGGIVEISTIGNVNGGNSSIGNPNSTANGIIGIRNSTLKYVGTGNETNRQITNAGLSATSTIDQSGTGLLKFTNSTFWGSSLGGGTMTLNLQGSTAGTGEISGVISNGSRTVNVTKNGTGTWRLSGANTYTGTTTVSNGTLLTTKAAALPGYTAASKVSVANGATLAVNVDAGGWTSGQIDTLLGATPAAFTSGSKLGIDVTTGSFTYSSNIGTTQVAKGLVKSGAGTLVLDFANTYTGVTTLTGGTLSVGSIGDGGVAGNLGQATNAAANIVFDGGTLAYTGANATSDRAFTINTDKTATINTTNNISFAGATGAATNGALTKTGAGTLTLTGASTYTGTTTVSGGKLVINGDQTAATGATTVESGGTLGGSGTLGGALTVNSGGIHAVGNSPGLQTIKGATTYNSGSIFEWDLAANKDTATPGTRGTDYDAVNINGALTVNSAAIFKVIENTGVDFTNAFWDATRTWSDIFDVTGSVTSGWSATAVSIYSTAGVLQDYSVEGAFTITDTTLTWTAFNVIPEPTSALAGLLLAVGLLRRRR